MSSDLGIDPDWAIRVAAFSALAALTREVGPILPWSAIERGFSHQGRRFLFANMSKGIFRPAGMRDAALSIKTTVPRSGQRTYPDIATDGGFRYSFQRQGLDYHDNKILLRAADLRTPLIYFFGIAPGHYRPVWPAYVGEIDRRTHSVVVVVGSANELYEPGAHIADAAMVDIVRAYATVEVKKRLHQDLFRHVVLDAYQERCTVCRLPTRALLDAAHIDPDGDVRGEPVISNGLALCKLHHGAYDANLLGIRPDYVIEIAQVLLDEHDGPTLEHGLKGFAGQRISEPRRAEHRPAPDRLESRYELFRKAG